MRIVSTLLMGLALAIPRLASAQLGTLSASGSHPSIVTLRPGVDSTRVYRIGFRFSSLLGSATVTSITFENRADADGDFRDAVWRPLRLLVQSRTQIEPIEPIDPGPLGTTAAPTSVVATATFFNGFATFSNLSIQVPAGNETTFVYVLSGPSVLARDGDALDLKIPGGGITASGAVSISTSSLDPGGKYPIDGMSSAQIGLIAVNPPTLAVGSTRNRALDLILPANGYQADELQRIAVQNLGTARAGQEITAVEAWRDDGDGVFDPSRDPRIGELVFTGDRWQLSGLKLPAPMGGVRLFVSVDIADLAEAGRTVRLALPTLPDVALGMNSNNDGPNDRVVSNPVTHAIVVLDRVTLSVKPLDPGVVQPDVSGVELLELVATNTYGVDKTLTGLTVTNAGTGPGTLPERDAEVPALQLREDADQSETLSPADPVIATAVFIGGRASFGGFAWGLAPGKTAHLFVTGDVSLHGATDGDVLAASLAGAADLQFSDPTGVSAVFPLGPGSAWTIDGQVAAQIENRGAAGVTLSPNQGPVPALDMVVRRNGYQDDVLERVTVVNSGSAAASDLGELRLWRDGGDGAFGGDDQDLGALTAGGGDWTSAPLSTPLGAAGARLFVSVVNGPTPNDSATVRLAIPPDGLQVQSSNDGPIDGAIVNPDALLLSNRTLVASVDVSPNGVIVGQPVTVSMTVRNMASEAVDNVTPSALTVSGTGGVAPTGGPIPASVTLPPGGQQVYTWTYDATAGGEVRFSGSAGGVGASSGLTHSSLPAVSDLLRIFDQAPRLPLTVSTAMPLSVNRGQTSVVPLFLSFGDGTTDADVRIRGLRLEVVNGSGAGIVPADLLSRVVVQVGGVTHLSRTSLETSGNTIDLTLATPIVVSAGASATAAVAIDISATTVVPNFRLVIPDSTVFTAEEVETGAPAQIALVGQPYPVRTGLARVVEEATQLDVAAVAGPAREAGQGQPDVTLATWRLTSPGITGVTSDVRVASFTVKLQGGSGAALAAPAAVLERLRVQVGPQVLADQPVTASQDSVIELTLSPLLSVPVNAPLDLKVAADLTATAALGTYRLVLGDSASFDARDPNSGNPVAVIYAAPPILGDSVTVERAADSVAVLGVPRMPPGVAIGSAGVMAMQAVVRHVGTSGTAAVRIDSLVVRSVDESRNPLAPGLYVERLHVWWRGAVVATLGDPPASGSTMALGLPGLTLEPGEQDTLTLTLDFEAAAPPGSFELILNASGLWVSDANTRQAVVVAAEDGFEFPLLSGLTRLVAPARTLIAGLVDRMPATLVAGGTETVAGEITLDNDAGSGSGDVTLDRFGVRAADASGAPLAIGTVASVVRLYQGGSLWGEATLAPSDTVANLGGAPLTVPPPGIVALGLRFVPRAGAAGGVRLGFTGADVGVVQPPNPLLTIAVQPPAGQSFPLWTETGNFTLASLEQSYSNFPNPFAAGREPTRFAYFLPGPGRVTLRIWTARGERVAALLEDVSRTAGLHELDSWDGRNGRGDVIANGVYVAELIVRFDGGDTRRLLRKVAVVR